MSTTDCCNGNVLVVDDEEYIANALKIFLEKKCYCVSYCTDGESAVKKVRENDYDCVITDYKMKKTNGLAVLHETRKKEKHVPVILISMYVDELLLDEPDFMQERADEVLQKPFDLSEILRLMEKHIQHEKMCEC